MLKSLYVAYDGSPCAAAALQAACWMAGLTSGRVRIGHVIELPTDSAIATGMLAGSMEYLAAVPTPETAEDLEQQRREREREAQVLLEEARRCCDRASVPHEAETLTGYVDEEILARARGVDLLAVGKRGTHGEQETIGRLLESIVRGSPQPVLVTTRPWQAPRELIVCYDGGDRALHALSLAAGLAEVAELPLEVVTAAPSREEAEVYTGRVRAYLSDHGISSTPRALVCQHMDRELIRLLEPHGEALVLMGAFGQSRLRQWITGSTTRLILRETDHPLVLFRY